MSGRVAADRQGAMACLRTAAGTDDAVERNTLRRRAAALILPRRPSSAARAGRGGIVPKDSPPTSRR